MRCQCCHKTEAVKSYDVCLACGYAIRAYILDCLPMSEMIIKYLTNKEGKNEQRILGKTG